MAMDINCMQMNFEVTLKDFSLRTMCAVKVVRQVLQVCGKTSLKGKSSKTIEKKAMASVEKLNFPKPLIQFIQNIIKPIIREIDSFGLGVNPIFTLQGTVNTVASTEAIMEDENDSTCLRFIAACKLCSVKRMFQLGKLLTSNDIESSHLNGSCVRFLSWMKTVILSANNIEGGENPNEINLQTLYNEGFEIAVLYQMDTTVNCFLDKVSPNLIGPLYEQNVNFISDIEPLNGLSAATHLLLFSKQNSIHQVKNAQKVSSLILLALLKWPNQGLFLDAARSLWSNLTSFSFWKILAGIAYKMASGFKDFDYGDLFVEFWKMGAAFRCNRTIRYHYGILATYYLLCSDDDKIVDFFLSEISTEDKEELLMEFLVTSTYVKLLLKKKFVAIERLIRGCWMGDRKLLVMLKKEFRKWNVNPKDNARPLSKLEKKWKRGRWEENMSWFTRTVNKIIVEECIPVKML